MKNSKEKNDASFKKPKLEYEESIPVGEFPDWLPEAEQNIMESKNEMFADSDKVNFKRKITDPTFDNCFANYAHALNIMEDELDIIIYNQWKSWLINKDPDSIQYISSFWQSYSKMHSKKWEQRKIEIQNERDSINKSKIRHAGWGDCIITEEEERAREESNKRYLQRQAENEQQQIEQQTITDCMKSVDSILAAEAETIRQMCTSTNNQYKK